MHEAGLRWSGREGQGSIRTAVHRRRRGPSPGLPPPPLQTKVTVVGGCFGPFLVHGFLGPRPPPPPPSPFNISLGRGLQKGFQGGRNGGYWRLEGTFQEP